MQELVVLCNLGPFTLTAYGLCVLAGAALGVAMTLLRGRKSLGMDASLSLCLSLVFSAWAGARVVYVLTQLEGILVDAEYYGLPFIPGRADTPSMGRCWAQRWGFGCMAG